MMAVPPACRNCAGVSNSGVAPTAVEVGGDASPAANDCTAAVQLDADDI